jgi:hypothetical protein
MKERASQLSWNNFMNVLHMIQVAALMNVGAAIFPLCAMFAIPALG